MPMNKQVIGKDAEGKDVNVIWGADLNWAHGFVEGPRHQQREYYRAQGRGNAYYLVARESPDQGPGTKGLHNKEFVYWYVTIYIDGKTTHLDTECMNAYEGQELCQIFESERACVVSKERTRVREEKKLTNNT